MGKKIKNKQKTLLRLICIVLVVLFLMSISSWVDRMRQNMIQDRTPDQYLVENQDGVVLYK